MPATHYPTIDLTGKTPAATYNDLLQSNTASSSFVDGLGYEITSVNITSSYSLSSSYTSTVGLTTTKSWVDTGTHTTQSVYVNNGLIISWSVAP